MKKKALLSSLGLLAVLLALSSCRDVSLDPVFYALEKEQPLEDNRGFPDTVTVERMVKTGSRYFAAAGRLYTRADGASDTWALVDPPVTNALCNALELFGGNLYAGFFDIASGAGRGLWRADPSTYNPAVSPNITWQAPTDLDVDDEEIVLIRAVGTRLFVATRSGNLNSLLSSLDGTTFAAVTWDALNPPPTDIPIIDVAQDAFSSSYWVSVGPFLYMDTSGDLSSFDRYAGYSGQPAGRPAAGTRTFGGLFDDGSRLYLAAGNGKLFSTADGGTTWDASAAVAVDKDPVPFTAFVLPASDAGALYVGTQGFGYYRIPPLAVPPGSDVTGTLVRSPAFNISQLYNGGITCLLYDGTPSPPGAVERLFLGTAGSGLWRGEFAGGSEWVWKQE